MYILLVTDLKKERKNILIYGAGEAGLITYSVLTTDKLSYVNIVGFIDDDKSKIGKRINGLNVYNPEQIGKYFIEYRRITEIVISIQKIKPSRLLEIVDNLSQLKVTIKIVPPVKNWINNDLKLTQIKEVKIEDLLGREVIEIENPVLKGEYSNKVIVVSGAAGSIGSEISKQLSKFENTKLVLIDQAESALYDLQQFFKNSGYSNVTCIVSDIRNVKRIGNIFNEFKPNIVFHAAAYKHVPFMEENPNEAVLTNVEGTKNLATQAIENGVEKFVMISTDKAVNPTNVMGATKRIAEMYLNSLSTACNTKFVTTRFGNVLGSNGSVIPLFEAQLKQGGPLTLTHPDITRFFMTIPEACSLVLEAGAMGKGGEIFVFDMGESVKIIDLAKNMIRLSGLRYPEDVDIKIIGLRPGEKIYEELLANGENTLPTHHEKIMIAKTIPLNKIVVNEKITNLCEENKELDSHKTVYLMKQIVPEFVSNNSQFECFDTKKN